MKNKQNKANSLIKRKNLIFELKKIGILGINKEALILLEELLKKDLDQLAENLKQEMTISGKRILKKEHIISVIKKLDSKNNIHSNWEI